MDIAERTNLRQAINYGLLAGVIALSLSMIGMITLFDQRDLISQVFSLGQLLLFAAPILMGYQIATKSSQESRRMQLGYGLIIGIISSLPLILLVVLASSFNIRPFFTNVTPSLVEILTFGQELGLGILILALGFIALSLLGVVFHALPERFQRPILMGLIVTLFAGLFSEILSGRVRDFFGSGILRYLFRSQALLPWTALAIFLLVVSLNYLWAERGKGIRARYEAMPSERQRIFQIGRIAAGIAFLIFLPFLLGTYLSEVINNVGIFILMGLGLNIVVGFAGLLDLGYVAFFAIGAYTMAVLTSEGRLGIAGLSFWAALPFSVLAASFAGIVLGIPVLRMRGDYLAIVTLGFGEIIRILALSDLLKPYIGGAQGVLQIPKPAFAGLYLVQPGRLYFIVLIGCLLAWYVSWRLSEARLGRQWMALREDEDVAEAMGINLVKTKLLAFAIGAAFSGLAGGIFASKLTSIFPHSFNLLISINVLCLIIVGGMGSLPGVVAGALVLVGLPELLREFAEYRMLMYGALLIVMMLARPEGFIPSAVRKRELHVGNQVFDETGQVVQGVGD